jgi:hypothetical protein
MSVWSCMRSEPGAQASGATHSRGLRDCARMSCTLCVPAELQLPVSYSGSLFQLRDLLLAPLEASLARRARKYRFLAARLPPDAGAALHAERLCGAPSLRQALLPSRRASAPSRRAAFGPRGRCENDHPRCSAVAAQAARFSRLAAAARPVLVNGARPASFRGSPMDSRSR